MIKGRGGEGGGGLWEGIGEEVKRSGNTSLPIKPFKSNKQFSKYFLV